MIGFNLYFDATTASNTVATIAAKNGELSTALNNITNCLVAISDGWGNEQSDFNTFKDDFMTCVSNYTSLAAINTDICTFVNSYIENMEAINSNVRSGE